MTIYSLEGLRPVVATSCWIAPGAHVIGQVELGDEVGIWFGAVLRGDNETIRIGARTNIQEHAMLHTDPGFPLRIGSGVTIGHRAIVHGCEIGDNSLVGMGAIVLNGAKVGRNCLIGAGALITEGKVVTDGSLVVGAPGKVVRELTDEQVRSLRQSSGTYVANAARFAKDLVKVGKAQTD